MSLSASELLFKVSKAVELAAGIELLVVFPVAAFYLAVVPGCSWTKYFVRNVQLVAEYIKRMNPIRFLRVCKLSAVVCLNCLWSISKEDNCPLNEINGFRSATIVNMGVCALRLNRTLNFDPVKLEFIGDEAANALIDQPMRGPWKM